ncbi:hypothetical protein ABVV53_12560 [Novosphingobium sp. RD2P27]|uniref:Uncharacterized protein n=1 Tax=Novosphingobium kalidii TaxID=3230299 RepID=A0ABV2D351_9SPHN
MAGARMNITSVERSRAGLSLLFAPGERPDVSAMTAMLDACQTYATITRTDPAAGAVEIVAGGLAFDMDGLAPTRGEAVDSPLDHHGFADLPDFRLLEGVRLYPGHHLSGGMALSPVVRALLALAAEIAVGLPVRAVLWHPAHAATEPRAFSHSVLAWLAGGAFPTQSLTALSCHADGTVISRGLGHFSGQEAIVSGMEQSTPEATLRIVAQVVGHLAQAAPLEALTELRIQNVPFCAEPAQLGTRVLVWPAG